MHARETLSGVDMHGPAHDLRDGGGRPWCALADVDIRARVNRQQNRRVRCAGERVHSTEPFVEHRPKRIHIALRRRLRVLAHQQLRRCVTKRPGELDLLGAVTGEAEVEETDLVVGLKEEVLGLQVAVEQARFMRGEERARCGGDAERGSRRRAHASSRGFPRSNSIRT